MVKGAFFFGERLCLKPPPTNVGTLVILHSLAGTVEQLCARSAGAPSVEELRPRFCTQCGQLARDGNGVVCVEGHGMYSRQVCGLSEGWVEIWVRRYLCQTCGHTMSRLPDWLHPWRWYAAAVIIEGNGPHVIAFAYLKHHVDRPVRAELDDCRQRYCGIGVLPDRGQPRKPGR